jgi:hypothetical protein
MSILLWLLGVPLSVVVVLWLVHVIYAGSTSVPRNRPTAEPVLPLSTVLANSPRATRREAGRAEHPNLLARHLSAGPSRSPRMGAADPPRPGRHDRRIAVLFGQLGRLGSNRCRQALHHTISCTFAATAWPKFSSGIRRLCHRAERAHLSPRRGRRGTERLWGCVNTEFRRGGSDTACLYSAFDVACGCGEMPQATLKSDQNARPSPQGPNGIEGASFP